MLSLASPVRATFSARSEKTTTPAHACPLQPFCGAVMMTSTPVAFMSTQYVPLATQSRTNRAPTP